MKAKRITAALTVFLLLSFTAVTVEAYTTGPPDAHTGAPGEQTCAKGGCHDMGEMNNGSGAPFIDGPPSYKPGKNIPVVFHIEDFSEKYGFEAVFLDEENRQAGTIEILEENTTQVSEKDGVIYLKHTKKGSEEKAWPVMWTPPPKGTGRVTIYAIFVSANNDNSSDHDVVYTFTHTMEEEKKDNDSPAFGIIIMTAAVGAALSGFVVRRRLLKY